MALTLNAEQKSIYKIFSGENQYIIPPYQRAYSWTNIECKALFEDIKKAFYDSEQEGYFLGNIVLAKSREERNKLEVIDGQQRLTSLTLLLKVLLSFDKDNKALYDAIWIKDRRTDEEIQRLETTVFMEKDFNYFKEVLAFNLSSDICNSIKEKDNLFKKNICYFYNELKEFKKHNDILKFSDFLLDSIYILPIETEDEDADKAREKALKIFETINNRGLSLSTSDIFKARLYSMALNELEHKEFIQQWKKLYSYSDKINYSIDEIFKIYAHIDKNNKIENEINLRIFFLEKEDSPFNHKKYQEIFNDLFRIIESINFYNDVSNRPQVYPVLAKYFQVIKYIDKKKKIDIELILKLYKTSLTDYPKDKHQEYDSLILFSRRYIRKFILKNYEMVQLKIDELVKDSYKIPKDLSLDIFTLLSFYLNNEQNAISPLFSFNYIMIHDTMSTLDKKIMQKMNSHDKKDGLLTIEDKKKRNDLTKKLWLASPFYPDKYTEIKKSLGNKIVVDFTQNYNSFDNQVKLFLNSNIKDVRKIGKKISEYELVGTNLEDRTKELIKRLAIFLDDENDKYRSKEFN
ncbi:MAG: DUF262 domain-containing protein [uncultured Sulfurovum sp.]|uniref:DUF262 domain-containing protein n=1 Tax=uncultured Sulfurovum sp. TaxID=269237 RepID=A0A6S6TC57_9BACT|nr:MAG: DUF262 domain-containing protein [uncultured Sulfurovum sp.]